MHWPTCWWHAPDDQRINWVTTTKTRLGIFIIMLWLPNIGNAMLISGNTNAILPLSLTTSRANLGLIDGLQMHSEKIKVLLALAYRWWWISIITINNTILMIGNAHPLPNRLKPWDKLWSTMTITTLKISGRKCTNV